MTPSAAINRNSIESKVRQIRQLQHEIDEIAEKAIPDFHFLDHRVSTFWDCDDSPVGMCVWDTSEGGHMNEWGCHFCGEPAERK